MREKLEPLASNMGEHKEVANGVKISENTQESDKGGNCCEEFCKCLFGFYNLIHGKNVYRFSYH